jgi:predicted pyridoxine 5'-phosphate oxidase superfamily flavin-nucleotide-binding protein
MAYPFGSAIFTSAIEALQDRYGSRRQYAKREATGFSGELIGASEAQFIGERDSFYMATVGEGGWPYVQHRGGPKGFLKVIDDHTLAFADFRGNKQFITTGNLMTDDRVALILLDYPRQTRLKILGRVQIYEGNEAAPWLDKLRDPAYTGVVERVFVIRVEASDWNCQQHITPRFSEEEIRGALQPWEERFEALEKENEELRRQLIATG